MADTNYTNLFNIDISNIRYAGTNIKLIKLGGSIIYEIPPLYPLYVPGEFERNEDITEVKTTVNETHIDLSYMFYGCTYLNSVNVQDWDTSNVINMSYMFSGCQLITILGDTSNWDTSKVTNMRDMFKSCYYLKTINGLSNWNTSAVTDMSHMFASSGGRSNRFTTLDVSNFDTSNVTDMRYMFWYCGKLSSLDVSNFDTSKVTNMNNMFANCTSLFSLDLSNWDTSNVTDMTYMFHNCRFTNLDLSSFNTSNVTNMIGMFSDCTKLKTLNLSNFDMSNCTFSSIQPFCSGCTSLIELRLDNCNNDTISKIINSYNFPDSDIGEERMIYCKRTNAAGLESELPENWTFSYID